MTTAARDPLQAEQDQARFCAAYLAHAADAALGRRIAANWPFARYEAVYRGQVQRIAELIRARTELEIRLADAESTWRRRALAAEGEVESLRRQLARALLVPAAMPAATERARPALPPRSLYAPAEPPEDRFAPPPERDPTIDAMTVSEAPRENPRQAQLLLLALTYPTLLDDPLEDIAWAGPLACDAAGWIGRDDPPPAAIWARLEAVVPPSTVALLQAGADCRKIRALFAECAAWERVANLKAEVAAATPDLEADDAEAAWARFQALHEELRLAEGRLAAAAHEEDMQHG